MLVSARTRWRNLYAIGSKLGCLRDTWRSGVQIPSGSLIQRTRSIVRPMHWAFNPAEKSIAGSNPAESSMTKWRKCPRCGTALKGDARRVKENAQLIMNKRYYCWGCMTVFQWTWNKNKLSLYTEGLSLNSQRPNAP